MIKENKWASLLVLLTLHFHLSFANACDKSEFAKLDCSQNNFRLTINQTCFDQHWNRGNAWTETMYLGNTNETDPCIFNVRNQSSTPVEILFTQCGVTSSFPNSTDISQVTFKLSGYIRESLNVDSSVKDDHPVEFECENESIGALEQNMEIKSAEVLKIEEKLVLNSTVLPAPTICVESKTDSSRYTCGVQATIGQKTLLDFPSSSNFRIDSIWVGSSAGEKTIQLVEDGCAFFPTDMVETHARSFYWDTFTFKDKNEVFFLITLTMCDPNDDIYCNGSSDCSSNKGNRHLFEALMNATTTTTTTTLTTTTRTTGTTTTTTCDQVQNGFGIITSPIDYPNSNYFDDEYCQFDLTADSGKYIKIQFDRFSVENATNCSYDSLEIDGIKYCGETSDDAHYPPTIIYIFSQTTKIIWKTDGSISNYGFSFTWESVDQGFGQGSGTVTSPNFPNSYDHCDFRRYDLTADPGKIIKIQFDYFEVEWHHACNYDSLTISGFKYCGESSDYSRYPPTIIYINSQTTSIYWETDHIESGNGFSFTWESVDESEGSGFSTAYSTESSTISTRPWTSTSFTRCAQSSTSRSSTSATSNQPRTSTSSTSTQPWPSTTFTFTTSTQP